MTELDPRIQASIGRSLRQGSHSPPAGVEHHMLAQFHAGRGGPPSGGESGGESGGDGGLGGADGGLGASVAAGGQLVHAIKIAAAIVGLTAAGLGGVWLVGTAVRANQLHADVVVDVSPDPELESPRPIPGPGADATPISAVTTQAEPSEASESTAASRIPRGRPAPSPASENSPATLAAELQLIRAARSVPAAQALELLDRHAEQFAEGELSSEREGLRIIALCELERFDEAQRAGQRFVAASPGALLLQRVRSACGDKISLPTTESKSAGDRSF